MFKLSHQKDESSRTASLSKFDNNTVLNTKLFPFPPRNLFYHHPYNSYIFFPFFTLAISPFTLLFHVLKCSQNHPYNRYQRLLPLYLSHFFNCLLFHTAIPTVPFKNISHISAIQPIQAAARIQ